DDDCDGQTDEGFTNIGTSCSIGQGACRGTGQYVCAADGLREECNAIVGAPAAELCGNNQDDDCDGQTDEGFTNLGNTCSVGQGACRGTGQYVCAVDGLRAECNATAGSPTAERCGNNQDDDCDGQTDEGFTNLGTSCSIGQGVCRVTGQYVCAADGLRAECNATAGSPTAERCGNNQDDDCDGQTDEGFTNLGTSCSVGQGACRRTGQYVCAADGLRGECNATAGTPIAELCGNNQDDDCDNQTDEGFDLGGACSVGTGECNAEGNMVCSEDGTSTVCSAEPGTPVEETCTGYDDDCDGFIDYRINPETGIPESVCSCDYFDFPIVLDGPGNTYQGSNLCEDTTCQIDSDGVLTMDVCHICSSPYPWSTCIFAKNQDFSIFDANAQAEGIVEIRYCIDQPIDGVVAVWYGADYRRKQFILSSPGESPGCYTRYFEPEDACFGEIGGLSSQCWDLCGYISNGNCLFQYGNSNIMLTVSACEGSYAGTVRLLSVTYLEDSCRCSDDTSCDTGTRTECTTVQPGLGLCTESDCEGRGDPCTTTVDGSVCNTSLTCLGDQAVCPTTGCE
ncbi:MAG: hypothetical protein JXA30_11695, partial [Deltaproteobacteria bacterium]|nr:hypothetical protein [Deltaproteobacteria bacterium]